MTECSQEESEVTTHVSTCCAESRNVIVDDFYIYFAFFDDVQFLNCSNVQQEFNRVMQ